MKCLCCFLLLDRVVCCRALSCQIFTCLPLAKYILSNGFHHNFVYKCNIKEQNRLPCRALTIIKKKISQAKEAVFLCVISCILIVLFTFYLSSK